MSAIREIGFLIGRPVLSVETANKLGEVDDILVDPIKGRIAGFAVKDDQRIAFVHLNEVHNIGPDAVMIRDDSSLVSPDQSANKKLPLAKGSLTGVRVVTDGGQYLGEIKKIYVHETETSLLIYEVSSSTLDKLLGKALYFPASAGCALSEDGTRLVVCNPVDADRNLEELEERVFGSATPAPRIVVRSHSE